MSERGGDTYPIQDDMAFQRRTWAVERAGWLGMSVLVCAAALGLLSHGPLSRTTIEAGTLALTYERLERVAAPSHFEIRVAGLKAGEELTLRLSADFLHKYDLEEMTPQPLRTSAGSAGFQGVFAAAASGDLHLFLRARARRFGALRVAVEAPGRGRLSAPQFIFP